MARRPSKSSTPSTKSDSSGSAAEAIKRTCRKDARRDATKRSSHEQAISPKVLPSQNAPAGTTFLDSMAELSRGLPKLQKVLVPITPQYPATKRLNEAVSDISKSITRINSFPKTAETQIQHSAASSAETSRVTAVKDIGGLVRAKRKHLKLSQQEFADLAGVGRRFVSELENGKGSLEFDKVLSVARAAGLDLTVRKR